METVLSVVTCGPQLEAALGLANGAVSVIRLRGGSRRSSLILAALDLLLEDASLVPGDVPCIAVTRGPGSFTGIRSGLATVTGMARATGARIVAVDSLTAHAARMAVAGEIWAAQPGRRGEVYTRGFTVTADAPPSPLSAIGVERVADLGSDRCWVAPQDLDLGAGPRTQPARSAAEALVHLIRLGVEGEPVEPLYVEGPPVPAPR